MIVFYMTFQKKKTKYTERLITLVRKEKDVLTVYGGYSHVTTHSSSSQPGRVQTPSDRAGHAQLFRFTLSLRLSFLLSINLSMPPSVCVWLVFADLYHSFNQSVFALQPSLFVLFHITPFVFTSSIRLPCPHIHLINLFSCPPSVHLW